MSRDPIDREMGVATGKGPTFEEVSIILPARNESTSLEALLSKLRAQLPQARILVVDDGSTDGTRQICSDLGVEVVVHPYAKGNGAAIKSGARAAATDLLVFMDADGQHRPEDIPALIGKLEQGFDMVVGARQRGAQASVGRGIANRFYNWLASYMTNQKIEDLTSGFRAVRAAKFKNFIHLLPNGFSYPTTTTMCFFRAGYNVAYIPIDVEQRIGKSHIRWFRDGVRFLLIIFKVGTLYSPMKLFLPISGAFLTSGFGLYIYNYVVSHRFTNMSALLLSMSVLIFLIGLVSEQITALMFKDTEAD
jgi:glycosyltransferase involved in cell wall biosynthesis